MNIKDCKKLVILTGAGISAESGIQTFRDSNGLWHEHKIEDVASVEGFIKDPQLVWNFYFNRRLEVLSALPNSAHYAITELAKKIESVVVITQNIDGLHKMAENPHVIELHGNIHQYFCSGCKIPWETKNFHSTTTVPKCKKCGSYIRPNIIWFGENLKRDNLEFAYKACQEADIILSVGTSAEVYPARDLPQLAKKHGAIFYEINPERTTISRFADVRIEKKATEGMKEFYSLFV